MSIAKRVLPSEYIDALEPRAIWEQDSTKGVYKVIDVVQNLINEELVVTVHLLKAGIMYTINAKELLMSLICKEPNMDDLKRVEYPERLKDRTKRGCDFTLPEEICVVSTFGEREGLILVDRNV